MRPLFIGMLVAGLGSAARAAAQSAPALPPDQCRIECLYRLSYQPDSTDKTDRATRTELLRLQLGSQLSRFESKATLFMDSVVTTAFASA